MIDFLFRIFKNEQDAGPTKIDVGRMALDERIDWRKEMVYKCIREVLTRLEVLQSMYRLKVTQIDERGHYFYVLVDISKTFALGKKVSANGFASIEELIHKECMGRYAVNVAGVYWRANDVSNVFDIMRNKHQDKYVLTKEQIQNDFADTQPMTAAEKRERERHVFQEVSKDEQLAFAAAVKKGLRPPPIKVGEKEYWSDMMPLSSMDGSSLVD